MKYKNKRCAKCAIIITKGNLGYESNGSYVCRRCEKTKLFHNIKNQNEK